MQMFLVTVSKHIKYISIDPIKERSRYQVFISLDKVFKTYNKADFRIHTVYADPEFGFMQDSVANLDVDMVIDDARNSADDPNINVAIAQEHVPEVERMIRVIKERYRSLWHRMPYKAMPIVMIQEAAVTIVK